MSERGAVPSDPQVVLVVPDDIRRYSIQGMFRSLDVRWAVRSISNIDETLSVSGGKLIVASDIAADPMPAGLADRLRCRNVTLLIIMDPADAVAPSWADEASAFLDWADLRPDTLHEAIDNVEAGRLHVSASVARRSVTASEQSDDDVTTKRASMITLSGREHQVLRLIAEGLSNRQVARSLNISEHAVKRTVGIILAKLNAPNRTLAVVRAMESGLLVM